MIFEYECVGYSQVGVLRVERWAPRTPVSLWLAGRTRTGRTVQIEGDPYTDGRAVVFIDGERAIVKRVARLRDGGTTTIQTDRGEVYVPSPIHVGRGQAATLDGDQLSVGMRKEHGG